MTVICPIQERLHDVFMYIKVRTIAIVKLSIYPLLIDVFGKLSMNWLLFECTQIVYSLKYVLDNITLSRCVPYKMEYMFTESI
jgi:hypothetical protein